MKADSLTRGRALPESTHPIRVEQSFIVHQTQVLYPRLCHSAASG